MTRPGIESCDRRRPRTAVVCAAAALLCLALAAAPSQGATPAATLADATVEVSFDTAAVVRLRGQRLVALGAADARPLDDVLARGSIARIERVVEQPEADIDRTRRRLLARGNRKVPDLNRHFRIVTDGPAARDELLAALRSLEIVDEVIREPRPAPAPASPSFVSGQRYGNAAPAGIGSSAVSARGGGHGELATIVDVEYAWNPAHEDLAKAAQPGAMIANGTPRDPFASKDHGTAVLGELIGTPNAFGVTGLAAGSAIGMVNAYAASGYAPANAIDLARRALQPGDVILLEQQTSGVSGSGAGADAYVPIEYLPSVYDAIKVATQSGIIVVEAAGNGAVDLDGAAYAQPFPQGKPDSGAIVVGAGSGDATCSGTPNSRLSFSTYGTRVNLQGWGTCVTTTGFGGLFDGGPNALYTSGFSGTSSAAPIVAAAAALYSSVFEAETGTAPSPRHVRSRLVATGTAQGSAASGNIGPLPDLVAALTGYDATPPTVAVTGPSGFTNDATPTFAFTASEPGATFECRVAGEASFSACASPLSLAQIDESATGTFEVRAIDAAFNTGPISRRDVSIDTVAPAVTIVAGPSGPTSDTTPTFDFSSDDPGATFACRTRTALDPGTFEPCGSPYTTAPLPEGARVFDVIATDAAANAGALASRAFSVVGAVRGSGQVAPAPAPAGAATVRRPAIAAASKLTVRATRAGWVALARPRVSCPASAPACKVTATVRPLAGGAPVGAFAKTVAAGASTTIRFRLTKKARATLKRRGRLKATVRIEARHGAAAATRTVSVTITRR
ncbi:MAG: serine protease [Solirubrobacteraceae bacterium]|nr:serine protease [Solirubrobacteraceae bacterium]